MINALGAAVLIVHFSLLLFLSLSGLHRLSLIIRWLRHRNDLPALDQCFAVLPKITVQVPLYNERLSLIHI